ncbi:hypothetical protein DVK44_35700 [Streptomyces paludis]|uniref:Uncharacterized protein n=1 Tax=Streptomyces paludis TaxID=2282738 RepID=A0A345HZQ7_9ACTN|nr:hypothetical protein DVK44_35700 [Streptomyces paludis]
MPGKHERGGGRRGPGGPSGREPRHRPSLAERPQLVGEPGTVGGDEHGPPGERGPGRGQREREVGEGQFGLGAEQRGQIGGARPQRVLAVCRHGDRHGRPVGRDTAGSGPAGPPRGLRQRRNTSGPRVVGAEPVSEDLGTYVIRTREDDEGPGRAGQRRTAHSGPYGGESLGDRVAPGPARAAETESPRQRGRVIPVHTVGGQIHTGARRVAPADPRVLASRPGRLQHGRPVGGQRLHPGQRGRRTGLVPRTDGRRGRGPDDCDSAGLRCF